MNRSLVLAAALPAALVPSCTRPGRTEGPPNVVIILADDLGWGNLSCYGQRQRTAPGRRRGPGFLRQQRSLAGVQARCLRGRHTRADNRSLARAHPPGHRDRFPVLLLGSDDHVPGIDGRQAVREGPWKLVHLDIRSERPRYELYNLDMDPGEENDLAAAKPEIVEHLKGLMREAHIPNPDFPVLPGE